MRKLPGLVVSMVTTTWLLMCLTMSAVGHKEDIKEAQVTKFYLQKIFDKYGSDGVMTFEGFEHLLENLGLGNVEIEDHDIHDHQRDTGFEEFHPDHAHWLNESMFYDGDDGDYDYHGNHDGDDVIDDHHHGNGDDGQRNKSASHIKRYNKHHRNANGTAVVANTTKTADRHSNHDEVHSNQRQKAHNHEHEKATKPKSIHSGTETGDGTSTHKGDHFQSDTLSAKVQRLEKQYQNPTSANITKPVRHKKEYLESGGSGKKRQQRSLAESSDDEKCLTASDILYSYHIQTAGGITEQKFLELCPSIIFQIDEHACEAPACPSFHKDIAFHCAEYHHHHGCGQSNHGDHDHSDSYHVNDTHVDTVVGVPIRVWEFWRVPAKIWGYATLSVTIISLVGLFSVALIPIMQKVFFNQIIQFLVSLAVGALTGDALLHLIPHSLIIHDEGSHGDEDEGHDNTGVWKGMVILTGVYIFFIAERLMAMFTEWKRTKRKKKRQQHKRFEMSESHYEEVGAKLSRHNDTFASCQDFVVLVHPSLRDVSKMAEEAHEELKQLREIEEEKHQHDESSDLSHEKSHNHGGHGHSHSVPGSVSAVAWMVIMGDGLHNFSDGLAIGASFASSLTGGLSTSIAVFCHELPHELGDFAVLLKAGMSVKQALFYNIVSSVLCFMGMVMGVCLGNISEASLWIFCLAAGMFIYISLVDMVPELASVNDDDNKWCHLLLQIAGITVGVSIMLLIALFEDDIRVNVGD